MKTKKKEIFKPSFYSFTVPKDGTKKEEALKPISYMFDKPWGEPSDE